jgi:nicotinamidase-related amidase
MPQVPIDPSRSALIYFDMLNCYVYPPDPERARYIQETGVIGQCQEIGRAARAAGMPIFYTNGAHRADGRDDSPGLIDAGYDLVPWADGPRPMWQPVAVAGTPAAEVIPELAPQPGDWVIPKRSWSPFIGTPLDQLLRGMGVDTVLLTGGSTDVGIVATAYSARDLNYHIIVLRDACQSPFPGAQDFCMDRLFPRLARVMTVEQAIELLSTSR